MHPLIQIKRATPVFLVTLVCFGLSPISRAVTPPPDGSYVGANTAEGATGTLSGENCDDGSACFTVHLPRSKEDNSQAA